MVLKLRALKWGISLPENVDLSDHVLHGKHTTRLSNRPISENTSLLYEGQFRQFWRYCGIHGKYQPMLMLLSPAPRNVPSMELSVVEEFPRFKRLKPGDPLMSTNGSTQLKDVFGTPMTCDGGWDNPKNAEHFAATIGDAHVANDRGGQYYDHCDACRALPTEERYKGCEHHFGEPRLCNKGNPTDHIVFKNVMATLNQLAEDEGYEEHGSSQLLPSDLRMLNTNLLSSGTIIGLQTWVIIISSVKQAWRHDDFYDLDLEHFLPHHFHVCHDCLSAIAMEVNGKADKKWIKQKAHVDNEHPELCPVRPMLICVHLVGVKGGFLFLPEEDS